MLQQQVPVTPGVPPHTGTRTHDFGGNSTETPDPVEFKSLQWFGATVRAHNGSILVRGDMGDNGGGRGYVLVRCDPPLSPSQACAPLYSWSPPKEDGGGQEPVGTCFLSIGNFSKFVEYAPCRSGGTPPCPPQAPLAPMGGTTGHPPPGWYPGVSPP